MSTADLWVTASAPGRVNLIGEHTDYHQGFVVPTVLPQRTTAAVRRRDDRTVDACSDVMPQHAAKYVLGEEQRGRGWLDYVQGVTATLSARGVALSGFDLRLSSTVPVGAGVSSSAALEVSMLRALRDAFSLPLDDLAVARIAQAAETDFVGAPVGIMDQMAASLGVDGWALFIDTRSQQSERLPLPPADLVVIDSGVAHQHAGGGYAQRRRESFDAAAALGVGYLRDANADALSRIEALGYPLGNRAHHIVTENRRVLQAVEALRAADPERLGTLFNASHESLRVDYEVSTPEVDALVALGQAHFSIYGARMTGGGFGGAVVMLARTGTGREAASEIANSYRERTGRTATVLVPAP
jgi:galactokinase